MHYKAVHVAGGGQNSAGPYGVIFEESLSFGGLATVRDWLELRDEVVNVVVGGHDGDLVQPNLHFKFLDVAAPLGPFNWLAQLPISLTIQLVRPYIDGAALSVGFK